MIEWVSKEPPLSTTTYKAVWTVWLWIGTAVTTLLGNVAILITSAILAYHDKTFTPPDLVEKFFDSWLFALVAFSGVTTAEFYGKRKTYVPYQEQEADRRNAEAAASTPNVNVEHAESVTTPGGPVSKPDTKPEMEVPHEWEKGDPQDGVI